MVQNKIQVPSAPIQNIIYASLFAAMDLSGKFTDNEIKNLYSLEVDLDGNVVCHVATRYEYMADWEEQYLE